MRWGVRLGTLLAALVPLGVAAPQASAVQLQTVGGAVYDEPVFVTSDPGNPNRLFVVERRGEIKLTTPAGTSTFADLSDRVGSGQGEQGLLSMAFSPDFAATGLLYVYYTGRDQGAIHVGELRAAGGTAAPGVRDVIRIPHAEAANHNGGQVQFGPDGYLYLATGDGGKGDDPWGNAQNLNVNLGKILRIDPRPSGTRGYSVPADNPFVGRAGNDEIWSIGLRNPFRFSFDRLTGALAVGDVGQGEVEEVDYVLGPRAGRGANFGWDCREGLAAGAAPGPTACPPRSEFTDPIHQYANAGSTCAITGGYVVRDPGLTELYGRYVYGDYCAGRIRSLVPGPLRASGDRSEGVGVMQLSSFGEDSCGRIYVTSLESGTVSRLIDATPTDCAAATPPEDCGVRVVGDRKANQLNGGPGSQAIFGRAGMDRIRGGDGNDCIDGGPGADRLSGDGGADTLLGGIGDDVIRARDGERDRVSCGRGKDRAIVDGKDRVKACERARRRAA